MSCAPLQRADSIKLWIIYGEQKTEVESSKELPDEIFGVEFSADRQTQKCMRVGWQVEPWGPNPANKLDFGGTFPSGTMDLIYDSHHDEVNGAIQIRVPNDDVREDPETFRIVLLDPVTRNPLAGTIGVYDPATGMRMRHPPTQTLDMKNRLVMTVEDAPNKPQGVGSNR